MSDEPYTNYDLELAEQKIIAAGGRPELADALYSYFQGWRNYTQGRFGQQFVEAYESTLTKHIAPITETSATTERLLGQVVQSLDQQRDIVQQILTSQKNSEQVAREALSVSKAGAARLGKLSKEVGLLKTALVESKEDRADLRQRIIRLEAQIEQLKRDRDGHAR